MAEEQIVWYTDVLHAYMVVTHSILCCAHLLPAVWIALCLHYLVAVVESLCWKKCTCCLCWLLYFGCCLAVVVSGAQECSTDGAGERSRVGAPSWSARRPGL